MNYKSGQIWRLTRKPASFAYIVICPSTNHPTFYQASWYEMTIDEFRSLFNRSSLDLVTRIFEETNEI